MAAIGHRNISKSLNPPYSPPPAAVSFRGPVCYAATPTNESCLCFGGLFLFAFPSDSGRAREHTLRNDQMQTALGTGLNALVAPASTDAEPQDVHAAYDGSNVLFRLLRMVTWGPGLMNLGYFRFRGPFAFLNLIVNLEKTQRRLVEESL